MKEQYPLYLQWQEVLEVLMKYTERFPKSVRHTLVDRIVKTGLDIMALLVRAIYSKAKRDYLRQINVELEVLRTLVQIAHACRYISTEQYGSLSKKVIGFGKGIGGWSKSCGA
ncbi:MAG: diversity-generating retroelement protein Avd [Paenibacillaceae bacterium]|nr:diversity-generating retroelement protein Avd [Paenibacillaceae bacterium]